MQSSVNLKETMNSSDLVATSTLCLFILYDSTFGGVLSARLLQARVEIDEILITFGDTGFAYNRQRVSGNSLDGIYEVIVSVPAGHKIGNFEVLLFPVDDENGNTYVPAGQVNGFISIGYVDVK